VGLAIAFLSLTLLAQVVTAFAARNSAETAVAAAARRAALPGIDAAAEADLLASLVEATVPGAQEVRAVVRVHGNRAIATARFRWIPPGPSWLRLTFEVDAATARVVPP
jgi:hypothetical protein